MPRNALCCITLVASVAFICCVPLAAQTWEQQTNPNGVLGKIQFVSATEGWIAAGEAKLLHTTDGGGSWAVVDPVPSDTVFTFSDPAASMSWAGVAQGWIIGTLGTSMSDARGAVVYRTTDGGGTWGKTTLSSDSGDIGIQIQFVDGSTGYATIFNQKGSIGTRLMKSIDGGGSWNPVASSGVFGLSCFVDANTAWATSRYSSDSIHYEWVISHTTDGGANWSNQYTDVDNTNKTLNAIQFTDLNHGWVAGDSCKFLRTTDGGAHWTAITNTGMPHDAKSKCIFFLDANNGWIGTSYAVPGPEITPRRILLHTTDGGASWTTQQPSFLFDSAHTHTSAIFSIYFHDVDNGWIIGDYGVIGHLSTGTGAGAASGGVPAAFALDQNYPNPFNPTTTIGYSLPSGAPVSLVIYDALGRCVRTLVRERQDAGRHAAVLDASGLSSGVYFYHLRAGSYAQTKMLVIVR